MITGQKEKYILKNDEAQARSHYRAFWQNESIGRPLFYVTATDDHEVKPFENHKNLSREEMDLDVAWHVNYAQQQLSKTFLYEAMPVVTVMFGRDITNIAVLAGGDYRYVMPTEFVVFNKNPDFLHEPVPALHSQDRFLEKVIEYYRGVRQEVGNKGGINPPTTLDALTTIAMILGEGKFYLTLKKEPDLIMKKAEAMNRLYYEFYNHIYHLLEQWGYGEGCSWFPVFAEGKFESVRCDVMAMASPEMFRRFALPHLEQVCSYMDYCMFNFETVWMIPFIDDLARIPGLQGVYWNLEPWELSVAKYIEPLKKVKKRGLALALPVTSIEDGRLAVRELGTEGLLLELPHFKTSAEAEYWVQEILKECK